MYSLHPNALLYRSILIKILQTARGTGAGERCRLGTQVRLISNSLPFTQLLKQFHEFTFLCFVFILQWVGRKSAR